jgi:hypothetical protein
VNKIKVLILAPNALQPPHAADSMDVNPYSPARESTVPPKRSEWRGVFLRALAVAIAGAIFALAIVAIAETWLGGTKQPGLLRTTGKLSVAITLSAIVALPIAGVLWFVSWLLSRRQNP